jgi:hypothetical protein
MDDLDRAERLLSIKAARETYEQELETWTELKEDKWTNFFVPRAGEAELMAWYCLDDDEREALLN